MRSMRVAQGHGRYRRRFAPRDPLKPEPPRAPRTLLVANPSARAGEGPRREFDHLECGVEKLAFVVKTCFCREAKAES
jgi:hypothetical protein